MFDVCEDHQVVHNGDCPKCHEEVARVVEHRESMDYLLMFQGMCPACLEVYVGEYKLCAKCELEAHTPCALVDECEYYANMTNCKICQEIPF